MTRPPAIDAPGTAAEPPARARWWNPARTPVRLLLLLLLCLLTYGAALRGGFVGDDAMLLDDLGRVTSGAGGWTQLFGRDLHPFGNAVTTGFYRPLASLSLLVDRSLFGDGPYGYHTSNLAFHVLSTWLVLALAGALGLGPGAALGAAALFAVHPVHVEAVAWISGRFDLLCGLFYFLAVWSFLRAHARRSGVWYLVALVGLVAALLAKEMALTLPVVLLLAEWLVVSGGRRNEAGRTGGWWGRGPRAAGLRLVPFVLLMVGYLLLRHAILGASLGRPFDERLPLLELVCTGGRGALYYLGMLSWPARLNACPIVRPVSVPWSPWFLGGALAIAALVVAGLRLRRRSPAVAWALFFLLVSLVPLSNAIPIYPIRGMRFPVAERYLYLTSGAFVLAVAAGIWQLGRSLRSRRPAFPVALAALLVIAGAVRSAARLPVWRTTDSVYKSIVRDDPRNPWAHVLLAVHQRDLKQDAESRRSLERALQLDPHSYAARIELADLCARQHRDEESLANYRAALAAWPESRAARHGVAAASSRLGKPAEAARELEALAASGRPDVEVLVDLGVARLQLGELDAAETPLRDALRIDPERLEAHYNLGVLALRRGDLGAAASLAGMVLASDSSYASAHLLLGDIARRNSDFAAAARQYTAAVALDSSLVGARVNLGAAYLDLGDYRRAAGILEAVSRQSPSVLAWLNLAQAQSRQGSVEAAERSFREALRMDPGSFLAKRGLGLLLADLAGRRDEARELLLPLLQERPQDPEVANAVRRLESRRR